MSNHNYVKFGITLLFINLSACQSLPSNWASGSQYRIESELAAARDTQSLKNTGIPQNVSQALLPPIEIDIPDDADSDLNPTFDLAVRNTRARDVYLGLVKGTAYSVVVKKGVSSRITLNLKNVTLDEAFEAIRDAYGYEYEKRDNKYVVFGKGIRTRIYQVNYVNVNRIGNSMTEISAGGLSGSQNASVNTKSNTDFWKSFETSLKAIIGEETGHSVSINAQTGLVVVTAKSDVLRLVENFIHDTHDAIGRQVILEAKIIEVELNDDFQTGINWGSILSSGSTGISVGQTGGGQLTEVGAASLLGTSFSGNLVGESVPNLPASGFGGVFSIAMLGSDFGAFIEMIQSQGDVQVLSSPRVATVNNQKAVIKVGGDEYYVTGVKSGSDENNSGDNNVDRGPEIEVTPFFSGIALDVTPQIDKSGSIILHLHPTVSEVAQRNKSFLVNGKSFNLPLAASTVRESDNIVKAESGQIIVVGGLMKETSSDYQAMVPFLGKIPFLGNLFKHRKISRVKKELVVLVKPTVIDKVAAWNADAKSTLDSFSSLRR